MRNGDSPRISDICADGFSAALEVDVAPLQHGSDYDFMVRDSKGSGTSVAQPHDVPEGTVVCVSAGIGHSNTGEIGGFGSWVCGTA